MKVWPPIESFTCTWKNHVCTVQARYLLEARFAAKAIFKRQKARRLKTADIKVIGPIGSIKPTG